MGHLTLLDVDMIPTTDDVDRWTHEATTADDTRRPFTSIRTGALFPDAAEPFRARGFVEADRLALLGRSLDAPVPRRTPLPGGTSAIRMRRGDLPLAGSIDAASFAHDWRNDADALADIAAATPQSRQRMIVEGPTGWPRARAERIGALAFAITGRAGERGYLQRLAVRPDARRRGIARHLVDDACRWLTRRGARDVLVNTGVDNRAAIELYERCGFVRRAEELVVLQLDSTE